MNTPEGLVVITGCAHPRVVEIVRNAKELTGEEVHLVIGGFHLVNTMPWRINRIIADFLDLGVVKVAPCHCSGDTARRLFHETYGEDYLEAEVGFSFDFQAD